MKQITYDTALFCGLQKDDGTLLVIPVLAWALYEALQTIFPLIFHLYMLTCGYLRLNGGLNALSFSFGSLEEEEEIDPHAKIYESFIDDRKAAIDLNDVDRIKLRGYNKYRYVSPDFIKRNQLIGNDKKDTSSNNKNNNKKKKKLKKL